MDDRDLLELAAEAAGIYWIQLGPDGCLIREGERSRHWNPLSDDGDALRLAVALRLDVFFFEGFREVHSSHCMIGESETWERYGDDPLAATRRSIVRAAAEMAKASEVDSE